MTTFTALTQTETINALVAMIMMHPNHQGQLEQLRAQAVYMRELMVDCEENSLYPYYGELITVIDRYLPTEEF